MKTNAMSETVTVTADWQEMKFPFLANVLILTNTSAVAGTIFCKTEDDFGSTNPNPGFPLESFTSHDRRIIDKATVIRVLYKSADPGQELLIEAWK